MRSVGITFLAVIFMAAMLDAVGLPIDPVPLRRLIEESDLIALTTVEPFPPRPEKERSPFAGLRGTSPALLRPLAVIKGNAPSPVIDVHFSPNMVCPSPPEFHVGSNVLAFLKRNTHDAPFRDFHPAGRIAITNGFRTIALSYGAKEVSEDEARAYSQAIAEYLHIVVEPTRESKLRKTTEWLVKCTENPHTRWDGAFELVERKSRWGETQTNEFIQYITASQRERLSNVLFQTEFISGDEWPLIRMFQETAKPQVITLLVRYLERSNRVWPPARTIYSESDSFPSPWNVFDAMDLVAELLNSKDGKALVARHARTDFFKVGPRLTAVSRFLKIVEAETAEKELPLPKK